MASTIPTSPLSLAWTRLIGQPTAGDFGSSVAVGADGRVVVTGQQVGRGGFIAVYDKDGAPIGMPRIFGDPSTNTGDLTIDSDGSLYVGGYYDDATDSFNPTLTKFDSDLNQVWTRTFGGPGFDFGRAVTLMQAQEGSAKMVLLAGGGLFPDSTESYKGGTTDAFIAAYDTSGNSLGRIDYATVVPDPGNPNGSLYPDEDFRSIATAGNAIYAAGQVNYYDTLNDKLRQNGVIVKYSNSSSNGFSPVLEKSVDIGDNGNVVLYDIAIDPSGALYVAGSLEGTLGSQTSTGNQDLLLQKYDRDLNLIWSQVWGSEKMDQLTSISLGQNNDLYATGLTFGNLEGQTHTDPSMPDILISKISTNNGQRSWTRLFGTPEQQVGQGIAYANESLYLTGFTEGNLGNQTAIGGGADAFLARVNIIGESGSPGGGGTGGGDPIGGSGPGESGNQPPFRIEAAEVIDEGKTLTITITPTTNPPKEFRKAYLAFKGKGLTDEDFANADKLGIGDGLTTRIALTGDKPVKINLDIASETDKKEARQEVFQIGLFSSIRFSDNWDKSTDKFQIATPVKVTIRDQENPKAPKKPSYQSTISNRRLNEAAGDETTITLTTKNVKEGQRIFWRAEGNKTNQFGKDSVNNYDFGASGLDRREGIVSIVNGRGSFNLKIAADMATEGDETFKIAFYSDKKYKQALHTTNTITIDDTSKYPANLPPSIVMGPVTLYHTLAGKKINVSDLVEIADPENDPITRYRLTNEPGKNTGYFRFNGKNYQGESLEVNAEQFKRVVWVAGEAGSADEITLTAFDEPRAYGGGQPRPEGKSRTARARWATTPNEKAFLNYAGTGQGFASTLIAPTQTVNLSPSTRKQLDELSDGFTMIGKGKNSNVAVQPEVLQSSLTPSNGGTFIGPDGGTLIGVDAGTLVGPDAGKLIGVDAGTLVRAMMG